MHLFWRVVESHMMTVCCAPIAFFGRCVDSVPCGYPILWRENPLIGLGSRH